MNFLVQNNLFLDFQLFLFSVFFYGKKWFSLWIYFVMKSNMLPHILFYNKKISFAYGLYILWLKIIIHKLIQQLSTNNFVIKTYICCSKSWIYIYSANIHKVVIHLLVWVYLSSLVFLFYTLKSFSVYLCHSSSFLLRVQVYRFSSEGVSFMRWPTNDGMCH